MTPEQIRNLEIYRRQMRRAIFDMLVGVAGQFADTETQREDGADEIYITHTDGNILRLRVEVDWVLYDPLSLEDGDTEK